MDKIKKENKRFIYLIIISILLTITMEIIYSKNISNIYVPRIITLFFLIAFIMSHFIFGVKKLYSFLIKNRYIVSVFMIFCSTVVGMLQNPLGIKDTLISTSGFLSLWWNIKFYLLLLVSYELFSIITNNNELYSVAGAIVVTFSGAVQWNFYYINPLIFGEIITVIINKIILEENKSRTILFSIATIFSSVLYAISYKSYAVSFAPVFISLIIWILIKNRELLKNKYKTIITTFFISIVGIVSIRIFVFPYKSENFSNDSKSIFGMFSYLYNLLLPYFDVPKREVLGTFISMFPVPLLFSLYYLYKYEKHSEFLLPITIVTVFEIIFFISGFPNSVQNFNIFSHINSSICIHAVNLANVYIMFYILENIDEKIFKFKHTIRITIIIAIFTILMMRTPDEFSSKNYIYLFAGELCILVFTFLNTDDKNYKKAFIFFIILFTLIGGVSVNPIIKDKNEVSIKENVEIK